MNVDEALLYSDSLKVSFSDDEDVESDEDRDFVSRGELVIFPQNIMEMESQMQIWQLKTRRVQEHWAENSG